MRHQLRGERSASAFRRRLYGAPAATFAILVLIVGIVPGALAAHAGTVLIAPYAGTISQDASNVDVQCKGTAAILHTSQWNSSAGRFTAGDRAGAVRSPCGRVGPYPDAGSFGYGESWANVAIPFSGVKGNSVNISINFQWHENTSVAVAGLLGCHFVPVNASTVYEYQICDSETDWAIYVEAEIWDSTNRTIVSQDSNLWSVGNFTERENFSNYDNGTYGNGTYAYHCTPARAEDPRLDDHDVCVRPGSHSGTGTIWLNNSYNYLGTHFNDTMRASHQYEILLYFEVYVHSEVGGYGFGSPNPSILPSATGTPRTSTTTDAATAGNGVVVSSIVL